MKHRLLEPHTKALGYACFLAVSAGAALSATAALVYQENFDGLTAGSDLNGQGGWTKTGDTLNVIDQGSSDYAAAGSTAAANWFEYTVPLGATFSTGWLWTSYTLEQNSNDTGRGAVLALYETAAQTAWNAQGVQYGATSNTWQIRPPGAWASSVSSGITVAAPDTIIGGLNLNTGTAYLWVNPDGTDSFDPADGGTADATLTHSKLEGPMSHLILNGRNDTGGSPIYDDIMVTTTSDELGLPTVPEPSITLLGGLGLLGLLRRRRS